MTKTKPKLKLSDQNGNAFSILCRARRAADKAKWSLAKWQEYITNAKADDYEHLLRVTMAYFDVG